MIDFEVASTIFWVSIDGGKPIPVNIFRKNGEWTHQAHGHLTAKDKIAIDGFVKERLHDMYELWKPHMKKRLVWSINNEKSALDAGVYANDGGENLS